MAIIALLDANVLYPAPVRDLLLHIATEALYQPKWSETIQQEWVRSLLAKRPELKRASLAKICKWMDQVYPDAQTLLLKLPKTPIILPDMNDVHVVETAIRTGANNIVTFNLKDFPTQELARFGIEAIHPDNFICKLLDQSTDGVLRAFYNQVAILRKPVKTADEVLLALRKCGLLKTEKELRQLINNSTVT